MSGYERDNRNVLRRCLKTASDGAANEGTVSRVVKGRCWVDHRRR